MQIFFLRYIEVLPININNWFYGDPSGKRRKKRNIQFINGTNNTINNMSSCEIGNMKNIDQIPEMVFGVSTIIIILLQSGNNKLILTLYVILDIKKTGSTRMPYSCVVPS